MIVRTRALVIAVGLVAMSAAAAAWAQAPQARITGFARDGSGAVLPGTTITATNQTTKQSDNAVTGADGSYVLSVAPGAYSVVATLSGFRRVAQVVEVGPGGSKQADFVLEATLSEEITVTAMKRDETILERSVLGGRADRGDAARARRRQHRRGGRERRRLHRAEPRPRAEPGRHARRLRRPDRARPARREGAGRRLPRRVGDLAVALHARPRPLRHRARRSAARSAGHAVRLRLACRAPCATSRNQPELGVSEAVRRGRAQHGQRRQHRAATSRSAFNVPIGDKAAALRVAAYYIALGGYMDAVQPDLSVKKNVNDGDRTGVRGSRQVRAERAPHHHAAHRLPDRSRWTAGTAIDDYNILANPFTTTRPAVTLGEREQFTQIEGAVHRQLHARRPQHRYNFGDGGR